MRNNSALETIFKMAVFVNTGCLYHCKRCEDGQAKLKFLLKIKFITQRFYVRTTIGEIKHDVCFSHEQQKSNFCRFEMKVSSFAFNMNMWIIFDFFSGYV